MEAKLWTIADSLLPKKDIETYTQALMDLGATLCTKGKPRCDDCPVRKTCVALQKGLTDKLPAPRPKKAVPSRSTTWLVLRHASQILLERRPSPGIWGGLWSFPEASGKDIAQDCRNLGYRVGSMRDLDQIEHGFTHFRLTIQPVLCEVSEVAMGAQSPGRLWLDIEEAAGAATPAPVRKLLLRLEL